MPSREFLTRRNALWQQLRLLPPASAPFEEALRELAALTGWNRERVLAGLGLRPEDLQPEDCRPGAPA